MQKQRLILSVSACITLVLIGVLVVVSKPFLKNKEKPSSFSRSHGIGHEALQQYSKFHLTHLTPYFPAVPGIPAVLPGTASNLNEFIHELKPILDKQQLPDRAFNWMFSADQILTKPHPNCGGTWMEFGVFKGDTINRAADYRKLYCEKNPPPIFGFDTFQGLPEQWGTHMEQGHFSLGGNFPEVRDNVQLIQGLFNESLPPFIKRHYKDREHRDITYLHIDCDLYHGAIDALTLLNQYLAPGCIVLFDDLINYPDYREHEIRALWEWLQTSKRQIEVVGVKGPLPTVDGVNKTHAMEINPPFDWDGIINQWHSLCYKQPMVPMHEDS